MWPFRRRTEREDPAPVWRAAPQAWRTVGPIQRMIGAPPVVNAVRGFTGTLSAWGDPSSLAPLGHRLGPTEPAGVVHDLLRPAAEPDTPAMPLRHLPAAQTPTQRQTVRRATGGEETVAGVPSREDGPDPSSGDPATAPVGATDAPLAGATDAPLAGGAPVLQRAVPGTTGPAGRDRSALPTVATGSQSGPATRVPAAPPTELPMPTVGPTEFPPPVAGSTELSVRTMGPAEVSAPVVGPAEVSAPVVGPAEVPLRAVGPTAESAVGPAAAVRSAASPEGPVPAVGADALSSGTAVSRADPPESRSALPVVRRAADDPGTVPGVSAPDRTAHQDGAPPVVQRSSPGPAETPLVSVTSSVAPLIGAAPPVGALGHGRTGAGPAISAVRPETASAAGVPGPARRASSSGHSVAAQRVAGPGRGGSPGADPARHWSDPSGGSTGGPGAIAPTGHERDDRTATTPRGGATADSGPPSVDDADWRANSGTSTAPIAVASNAISVAPGVQRAVSMPTVSRGPVSGPTAPVSGSIRSWPAPDTLPMAGVDHRVGAGLSTAVQRDQAYDENPAADPGPEPAVETPAEPAPAAGAASRPPTTAPPSPPEPDELAKTLFEPLLRRLRTELRLDRERRGMVTDRW